MLISLIFKQNYIQNYVCYISINRHRKFQTIHNVSISTDNNQKLSQIGKCTLIKSIFPGKVIHILKEKITRLCPMGILAIEKSFNDSHNT